MTVGTLYLKFVFRRWIKNKKKACFPPFFNEILDIITSINRNAINN